MNDVNKLPTETGQHPRGALAITLIYLAVIIAGWAFMYFNLLSRGVNQ